MRLNRLDYRLIADRVGRSKAPASLFDTAALPAGKRFAAWRDSMGVLLDIDPISSHPTETFNTWLEGYLIGDILLSRLKTGGQRISRTSARIARDSIDHYAINFFLDGDLELHGRRPLRYGKGSLIGFDDGEPLVCESAGFDVITATIPRRRLAQLLLQPESLHAAIIDPTSAIGQLLIGFVKTVYTTAPDLTPDEAGGAAQAMLELISVAINGVTLKAGDLPAMFCRTELMRAQAFIKANLGNRGLTPDMVAGAVALSRAQLYRLFADVGGIADYIREQRLRRCLADLLTINEDGESVAVVAYRWGFADPSHFAKAFKQRFGRTPSEAKEAGALGMRSGRAQVDARAGDRLYEEWLAGIA